LDVFFSAANDAKKDKNMLSLDKIKACPTYVLIIYIALCDALVAISKGTVATKLCCNKIMQFLTRTAS